MWKETMENEFGFKNYYEFKIALKEFQKNDDRYLY